MRRSFFELPVLCRQLIVVRTLESFVYSIFISKFLIELYKNINASLLAFSDMFYSVVAIVLSGVVLKRKDTIIRHFKKFVTLDIVTNVALTLLFLHNTDWKMYWVLNFTVFPCVIQQFIDVAVMRINFNACPDDRMKEDVQLYTKFTNGVSSFLGGVICMLLDKSDIYDLTVWTCFILVGMTLSSFFYLVIVKDKDLECIENNIDSQKDL